jgi:hypothetical protein
MPRPQPIPFPLSSFPGANPQEGAGRLINCYAEPLGESSKPSAPAQQVWRGSAGLSQHAITAQTGYRGGLIVKNLSYETFLNTAMTVDVAGAINVLGAFPGSKKVSIARNQAGAPDVVAVDVDNGAYHALGRRCAGVLQRRRRPAGAELGLVSGRLFLLHARRLPGVCDRAQLAGP